MDFAEIPKVPLLMEPLTIGYVNLLYNGNAALAPIVQVFSIEQIGNNVEDTLRYGLYISNGAYKHWATLLRKYNKYVSSKDIKVGTIICLAKYSYSKSRKLR